MLFWSQINNLHVFQKCFLLPTEVVVFLILKVAPKIAIVPLQNNASTGPHHLRIVSSLYVPISPPKQNRIPCWSIPKEVQESTGHTMVNYRCLDYGLYKQTGKLFAFPRNTVKYLLSLALLIWGSSLKNRQFLHPASVIHLAQKTYLVSHDSMEILLLGGPNKFYFQGNIKCFCLDSL